MASDRPKDRYLGDGVYASFDGFQVWLDTRAQSPVQQIALEPHTLLALDEYVTYVREFYRTRPATNPSDDSESGPS